MRRGSGAAIATLLVTFTAGACAHPPSQATAPAPPHSAESMCHRAMPVCAGTTPTYANDVRPILERHCFKCHAGDGIAADEHDFSHVETLRAQKRGLASEIGACAMPPSPEAPIEEREADVLLRWVACGSS